MQKKILKLSFELALKHLLQGGVEEGIFPGAVACVSKDGKEVFFEAVGHRMITPEVKPMRKNSLFDLASLTKPIATATSVLTLSCQAHINLHEAIANYLPEFKRRDITVFQLLTHTSGLPAWKPLYLQSNKDDVVSRIGGFPLENPPGEKVVYSCLGYILLGKLVERISGIGLDEFAKSHIFSPLNMNETGYNPSSNLIDLIDNCAATEDSNSFEKRMVNYQRHDWREGIIIGQVHDENANFLGGVSGNAGLFSTASDLAKYCQMILSKGEKDEKRILDPDSLKWLSTDQTPNLNESRSAGWIILEDGTMFHTGFTGTAIWINLNLKLFAIILTNRVHPDASKTGIVDFRKKFYAISRTWQIPKRPSSQI